MSVWAGLIEDDLIQFSKEFECLTSDSRGWEKPFCCNGGLQLEIATVLRAIAQPARYLYAIEP
jgi:hypothetical protein